MASQEPETGANDARQTDTTITFTAIPIALPQSVPLTDWGKVLGRIPWKAVEQNFEAAASLKLVRSELRSLHEQLSMIILDLDRCEENLSFNTPWESLRSYWLSWADWHRSTARKDLLSQHLAESESILSMLEHADSLEAQGQLEAAARVMADVQLNYTQPNAAYRGLVGFYQVEQLERVLRCSWFADSNRSEQESIIAFIALSPADFRQKFNDLLDRFDSTSVSVEQKSAIMSLVMDAAGARSY